MIRMRKIRGLVVALSIIGLMNLWYFMVLCGPPCWSGLTGFMSSLVVYPVLRIQHYMVDSLGAWQAYMTSSSALAEHLAIVRQENEQLKADVIRLQGIVDYTQDVQEQVAFARQYALEGPISQILMKQLTSQGHFCWIDRGSRDGIAKDMVAVYKNNLIGRVLEVYPWYSKIQLVTDSGCKVAGYCAGTQVHGIHKGCNTDCDTVLTYVSHLEQLIEGDMVLSSGEGLVFPRGLLLGRIVSCKPEGLYQHVQLKTDVDMHALKYCMVLTKGNKSL